MWHYWKQIQSHRLMKFHNGWMDSWMNGWMDSWMSVYYLDPGLSQFGSLGQLLPGVDVRVVGSLESLLQLLQLLRCERGSTPALLPLQGEVRL